MTIDINAIPLDEPKHKGPQPCRCVDCDHRIDLGDGGNGCDAHPVEADRDIARRHYCADFKPKG